ncbi:MAG TPA: cupin domain-containing protein [Methylomirabilota bacterium]|nr:cupin domain-containing protein [Methylomirabilota bacterium]
MPLRVRSPLASWFAGPAALERFRGGALGRRPVVRLARDGAWRHVAPDFRGAIALARGGAPFQIALERRYDRSGDPSRLAAALRNGATVYFPQVHQILPRVMRLMVALRASLLGPFRDERSFLFLVEGRGRSGMGLHHDGEVDAFWLQLEGSRRVTLGPPVAPRTPLDLTAPRRTRGWRTIDLPPGSLLHLPPRTPHDVVCHGRSLALSLTWRRARRYERPGSRAHAMALTAWDVASGRAHPRPRAIARRLWTQVPAVAGRPHGGRFPLWTPDGALWLPRTARGLASRLSTMPVIEHATASAAPLLAHGVLADEDLPLTIVPDAPAALDGWRFA